MQIEPMAGLQIPPMDTLCCLLFKKFFHTKPRRKLRLSGLGACPAEGAARGERVVS